MAQSWKYLDRGSRFPPKKHFNYKNIIYAGVQQKNNSFI